MEKKPRMGVGLWQQLSPEANAQIMKMWEERMERRRNQTPEETAQEIVDSIKRGHKLITDALQKIQEDRNVFGFVGSVTASHRRLH